MSFLNKIIFKTFLFLAFMCFCVSSVFAKDYFYYQSWVESGKCNIADYQSLCQSAYTKTYGSNSNYQYKGCYTDGALTTGFYFYFQYDTKTKLIETSPGVYDYTWTGNNLRGGSASGASIKHVCPDGQKFELIGCTPKCVPDPCAPLKDQQFSGASECGSFACNTGTLTNGSCDGKVVLTGAASSVTDSNQCIGTLVSNDLTKAYYKKTDDGKSSGTAYCSATYKYTGVSDQSSPTPLDLSALALYQAVPLPDNGICPDSKPLQTTINGIDACIDNKLPDDNPCPVAGEKPNANGVCVGPNDPTYPDGSDPKPDPNNPDTSCPKGEIRNNQGKCVPYADATKCPAGEIRDNLGICSPDPKSNSCPQGTVKNTVTGACITDPRGSGCEGNALPDKNGMCPNGKASCPVGMVRNSSGSCVSSNPNNPPEGTGCKDGSTADANGKCADGSGVCPAGQVRNIQGKCVVDSTNTPSSATASGDCLSAPECSGDIVQCGLMHQQWQSGCDLKKAMTDVPEGGDTKYSEVGTNSNDARVTDALGGLSQQADKVKSFLVPSSGASCPADMVIHVLNKSVVLPLSSVCPLFQFLRYLLHFMVNLVALRILYTSLVRV